MEHLTLILGGNPRDPVEGVLMEDLEQNTSRQFQATHLLTLKLEGFSGGEVPPIHGVGFPPRTHRSDLFFPAVFVVRAIEDTVLILDQERSHLLIGLHHQVERAPAGIDGEVRVFIQSPGNLIYIRFHATKVRAHHAQIWICLQDAVARREE